MASKSKMISGSPLLTGSATTPGVPIPPEIKKLIPTIIKKCQDFGLDFFPVIVEFLTYDQISEIAAYGGFPVRYPHWRFGMEYEELSRGYEAQAHRIFEMVINACPCVIYCLDSNTTVDNVTVIAHAIGHNDFFKNNVFFSKTDRGMVNKMANHGSRIRKYMERWGNERVTDFIDRVLSLETLINPHDAWVEREFQDRKMIDSREYEFPHMNKIKPGHEYMDPWLNRDADTKKQWDRIKEKELAKDLGISKMSEKNIFRFLKDNAPLAPWEQDVMSMLYDEAMYFAPQRATKTGNEGHASWVDYKLMAGEGLVSLGQKSHDMGIFEYSLHKMGVLGGKYSTNPYKLGFSLLLDIEERWNKGQFGTEWEQCDNYREKKNWDKKLGLGKEKVLEVRKYCNDYMLIKEFFTEDFCEKYEFFDWVLDPETNTYKIASRDFKAIKKKLLAKYQNAGLPDIRIVDSNHAGKGHLLLDHKWEGDALLEDYARRVLANIWSIWKKPVILSSRNANGEEIVVIAESSKHEAVEIFRRGEYEHSFLGIRPKK